MNAIRLLLFITAIPMSVTAAPIIHKRQQENTQVCSQGGWGCDENNNLYICEYNSSSALDWIPTGALCQNVENVDASQPIPDTSDSGSDSANDNQNAGNSSGTPQQDLAAPPAAAGDASIRCGKTWIDANSRCGTICTFADSGCPNGERCFKDLTASICSQSGLPAPAPNPQPQAPAPQPEQVPQQDPTFASPTTESGGGSTRCGKNWSDANSRCGTSCTFDDNACPSGEHCYKDLNESVCSSQSGPAPAPQPEPAPAPQPQPDPTTTNMAGKIFSLISESDFNKALSACKITKPGLYASMTEGFTALLTGGLEELALLLGNTAHESASFTAVEEFNCVGVTAPNTLCPYGKYHGRGYIQLSWQENYSKASSALGLGEQLVNNPDLVMNDEKTNWATVQWYWTTSVQPYLQTNGYTLGNSVHQINGPVECPSYGKTIAPQRVDFIRCFQQQLTGGVNDAATC